MSVVIIATTPGLNADQYDQIIEKQGLGGALPPGCSAHIAGPAPDGWRVVSVWDSSDAADAFLTDVVRPLQAELGIEAPPAPPVVFPLHALVK